MEETTNIQRVSIAQYLMKSIAQGVYMLPLSRQDTVLRVILSSRKMFFFFCLGPR